MDEVRCALSTIELKDMIASAVSAAMIMSITNTSISVKPLLFDTDNLIHPVAKPYCKKTISRKIAIKNLAILQTCLPVRGTQAGDLPAILRYRRIFALYCIA
jgi:hypothetical protein